MSKRSGKSLCGADGLHEQETQQYISLVGTALYVGQDRPETQYATKEAASFMSGPTSAAKCMLKRLCQYYSEAPVLSCSFQYQEMPSEIRAVTKQGLSTAESEYISITRGAAHALEVRSAMMDCGMTFNVVCETDASAGRAMATRRDVGRVRHLNARLLWTAAVVRRRRGRSSSQAWRAQRGRPGNKDGRFEANDLAFEKNTPSTANGLELMDGGGDSPRGSRGSKILPCTNLEREEYVRDEWLVLDLCGNGHCDPDGAVGQTVCESHWTDD